MINTMNLTKENVEKYSHLLGPKTFGLFLSKMRHNHTNYDQVCKRNSPSHMFVMSNKYFVKGMKSCLDVQYHSQLDSWLEYRITKKVR